jgi:hypothetical protein
MKKKTATLTDETVVATVERQEPAHLPVVNNTPDMLLALGIEKGLDINQLEKLMDMQERWLARQAKSKFLEAKANFQHEVPKIQKNKKVGYDSKGEGGGRVDYSYAPLGDIAEQIKGALHKNGLSYDWKFADIVDEKGVPKIRATFIVSHVAGHSEETSLEAYHDASGKKNSIQARGSAVTYLQRYSLIGGLGLTTADSDIDGKGTGNAPDKKTHNNGPKPPITEAMFKKALVRISNGEQIVDQLHDHYELTEEQENAITALQASAPASPQKGKAKAKAAKPDAKEGQQ